MVGDQLIGQVCHIEDAMPGGRWNPDRTNEDNRREANLMLMCYEHHVTTDDVDKYPTEKLVEMKRTHEQSIALHGVDGPERRFQPGSQTFGSPPLATTNYVERSETDGVVEAIQHGPTAISGMGGIGKSQLAARLFSEMKPNTDRSAWIDMRRSRGRVAFENIAISLNLPIEGRDIVEVVRNFISTDSHSWLLVFDNVELPSHIEPLIPNGAHVDVIITSRYRRWGHFCREIPLGVFEPQVAAAHLASRAGREVDSETEHLAQDLGYLPLALTLAGAYCAERAMSFASYRQDRLSRDLLEALSPLSTDGYDRAIHALWRESLTTVESIDPAAVPLLQVLSALDWGHVDREWFVQGFQAQAHDVERRIALLASFALIELDEFSLAVIHNLVADGVVYDLAAGDIASELTRLFAASLVRPAADAQSAARLEEPMRHLIRLVEEHPELAVRTLVPSLVEVTEQLNHEMVPLSRPVLQISKLIDDLVGVDHPEALQAKTNLALAHWHAGEVDSALTEAEYSARRHEELFGLHNEETLTAISTHAAALTADGRYDAALALEKHVVELRTALLGADHPDTLNAEANLATTFALLGKHNDAIEIEERVHTRRSKLLGTEHPDTLTSWANLAASYSSVGYLDEAVAIERQLVEIRRDLLGPEHPETLTSIGNLAYSLDGGREDGDVSEARLLWTDLIVTCERVLGKGHPFTLEGRNNLAFSWFESGELSKSIPMMEAVVADSTEILGSNHPETLVSLHNWSLMLYDNDQEDEAMEVERSALEGFTHSLGPDHPSTLRSELQLAVFELAEDALVDEIARIIRHAERVLDADHEMLETARDQYDELVCGGNEDNL